MSSRSTPFRCCSGATCYRAALAEEPSCATPWCRPGRRSRPACAWAHEAIGRARREAPHAPAPTPRRPWKQTRATGTPIGPAPASGRVRAASRSSCRGRKSAGRSPTPSWRVDPPWLSDDVGRLGFGHQPSTRRGRAMLNKKALVMPAVIGLLAFGAGALAGSTFGTATVSGAATNGVPSRAVTASAPNLIVNGDFSRPAGEGLVRDGLPVGAEDPRVDGGSQQRGPYGQQPTGRCLPVPLPIRRLSTYRAATPAASPRP